MDSKTKTKNYIISGKVQGVWFRANTQKTAQELGITGWVRNLPDGNVEVTAQGTEEQLKQLETWLQHGPDLAKVENIKTKILSSEEEFEGFEVRK